ncbi:MAG: Holliday junction resolvase RuvX [bacterium]
MLKNKITTYLGIDWGTSRVGLAMGDSETKIATPYKVVNDLNEILEIIKQEKINEIVIGRPVKMSGDTENLTLEYGEFIISLKNNMHLPVREIDERLTSKAADALFGDKIAKVPRDAVAAMLILQSYLDRPIV